MDCQSSCVPVKIVLVFNIKGDHMKNVLILSIFIFSQSAFSKTIDEETKERVAIVNKASFDRATAVVERIADLAAMVSSKLTSAGVVNVEVIEAGVIVSQRSDETIYNELAQSISYGVSLMSGDLCKVVIANTAAPFSDQRAVQLKGSVMIKSVTCVGPQGETVVETTEKYSNGTINSVTGVTMNTDEVIAGYTFTSFDILL